MSTQYTFGKWVKARREQAHLTANELAILSSVTMSMINMIEKEKRGAGLDLARKLAIALQIPDSMHKEFIEWANRRNQKQPRLFPAPETWPYTHHAQIPFSGVNPYKGLKAFHEEDAKDFFGRRELVLDILERIAEETEYDRFLAVIGPSGSGKSSLVRAGFIPALKKGGELRNGRNLGSRNWRIDSPIRPDRLTTSLSHSVRLTLEHVVIVDQFEELFTHKHTEDYIKNTLQLIYNTVKDSTSKQRIILTMRADFLERALQYHPFAELITSRNILVGTLNDSQIVEVIEEPAKIAGLEFAPDLIRKMVHDMGEKPSLPLLQVTLKGLVDHPRFSGRTITLEHYNSKEIGGISGALNRWASKIYEGYADPTDTLPETTRQTAMRRLFLSLIKIEDEGTFVRRKVARDDLLLLGDEIDKIITQCYIARLLTLDGDEKQATVEIIHEALIEYWSLLKGWAKESSEHLRLARRLELDVNDWKQQKGPLASGYRLEQYEELKNAGLVQDADQIEFLRVSSTEENRRIEEEKRRQKIIDTYALVVGARHAQEFAASARAEMKTSPQRGLLFALEAIDIWKSIGTYRDATAGALLRDLLSLAGGSPLSGHTNIVRTVASSADGRWLATRSIDGQTRLWDVTKPNPPSVVLDDTPPPAGTMQLEYSPMVLAFSPEGHWLATTDADHQIKLRDVSNPQAPPIVLRGHKDVIRSLVFSPNNHWLMSGSNDGTVRLWRLNDTAAAQEPVVLTLGGHVIMLAISTDGSWLAAVNWTDVSLHAGFVHLYQLNQSSPILVSSNLLGGEYRSILAIAFGSKQQLVIADGYNVLFWDSVSSDSQMTSNPKKPVLLQRKTGDEQTHAQWVLAIGMSHNGRWIATGGGEAVVKLWDLNDPDFAVHPISLHGHNGAIRTLAFSPDDKWLATGGLDNTVRLWNLNDLRTPPVIFRGHEGTINALIFSPDSRRLATASSDKMPRLWAVPDPLADPIVVRQHETTVLQLAVSPDGPNRFWLASISADGVLLLNRYSRHATMIQSTRLSHMANQITSMAFSPNGDWLATAQWGMPVHIWNIRSANPETAPDVLSQITENTIALAFDPRNRWLATGCRSGMGVTYLWDMNNLSANPIVLDAHQGGVTSVAFSQDRNWLATAGWDATARLWRMSDDGTVGPCLLLQGHGLANGIRNIAFSHDSHYLVTPNDTGVTILWDLTSSDPRSNPIVHQFEEGAMVLACSADNKWLAIGVWDNTAQLIDLEDPYKAPYPLYGHQGRVGNVLFSPDNRWLASVGEDIVVRMWNLENITTNPISIILQGHEQSIAERCTVFSPDGRWLITGGDDTTMRFWRVQIDDLIEVARRTAGRELTPEERRSVLGEAPGG